MEGRRGNLFGFRIHGDGRRRELPPSVNESKGSSFLKTAQMGRGRRQNFWCNLHLIWSCVDAYSLDERKKGEVRVKVIHLTSSHDPTRTKSAPPLSNLSKQTRSNLSKVQQPVRSNESKDSSQQDVSSLPLPPLSSQSRPKGRIK